MPRWIIGWYLCNFGNFLHLGSHQDQRPFWCFFERFNPPWIRKKVMSGSYTIWQESFGDWKTCHPIISQFSSSPLRSLPWKMCPCARSPAWRCPKWGYPQSHPVITPFETHVDLGIAHFRTLLGEFGRNPKPVRFCLWSGQIQRKEQMEFIDPELTLF